MVTTLVRERDDGIVVRGARPMTTFAPFSNEVLVYPMTVLNPRETAFAVWFAVPIATPGLKLLCREPYTRRDPFDHPLSARFDEQDATVIFDDVFVPWERVFLANDPARANGHRIRIVDRHYLFGHHRHAGRLPFVLCRDLM